MGTKSMHTIAGAVRTPPQEAAGVPPHEHQLVMELTATHIQYTDMNALALTLPKQQLALSKSTAEQRLVWELVRR